MYGCFCTFYYRKVNPNAVGSTPFFAAPGIPILAALIPATVLRLRLVKNSQHDFTLNHIDNKHKTYSMCRSVNKLEKINKKAFFDTHLTSIKCCYAPTIL